MSTNFYWLPYQGEDILPNGFDIPENDDDPRIHIGLRTGAGSYCWKCNRPIVWPIAPRYAGQTEHEEHTGSVVDDEFPQFEEEGIGGRKIRLRFAGIGGSYLFTWAQSRALVEQICKESPPDEKIIRDEYGTKYTGFQFMMIMNLTVSHDEKSSIGQIFF